MPDRDFIPIELVFNPNWWHQTAAISFDEPFYMDPGRRIKNDQTMRQILHQRFGEFGMGEPDPQPRPVIGSLYVAGGFVIPALLGSDIIFEPDAAPQPRPIELTIDQIEWDRELFRVACIFAGHNRSGQIAINDDVIARHIQSSA